MSDTKTTWGAGEYARMAKALDPASRLAVEAAGVSAGQRVLDVATGTGNAALLAAARGAQVTGVDFEPALLKLAEQRAREAGLEIVWVEGDVQALAVSNGWADVVLSVFGAMYAPDHSAAARELVRVTAPTGRIVLAAWTPGSFMPAMGGAIADYLPPPPSGTGPPSRWGDPSALDALFSGAGAALQAADHHHVDLRFPDAAEAADFLIETAGHIVSQRDRLVADGRWQALCERVTDLVVRHGRADDGHIELTLDYLIAVAQPR